MVNPMPAIMTALTSITGLKIQQGQPETFADSAYPFDTYNAIGWYDLADNYSGAYSLIDGVRTERYSKVVVTFQFYTQGGADASTYAESIDTAMLALGYDRAGCNTFNDAVTDVQTLSRTIMRFKKN